MSLQANRIEKIELAILRVKAAILTFQPINDSQVLQPNATLNALKERELRGELKGLRTALRIINS